MGRETRCQAVILQHQRLLVARQFNDQRQEEYWLLPGGGLEEGEQPEDCIRREVREETGLDVAVDQLLFDLPGTGVDVYRRYLTFLCRPVGGAMQIGAETVSYRRIVGLVWVPLGDSTQWNRYLLSEQFYPSMQSIRERLRHSLRS